MEICHMCEHYGVHVLGLANSSVKLVCAKDSRYFDAPCRGFDEKKGIVCPDYEPEAEE